MGCCDSKTPEETIESIFSTLPIKKVTINEFLSAITKNKKEPFEPPITENQYQEIINTYCESKEDNGILNDYWFEFYNSLKFLSRNFYVQFCFSLLCKYNPEDIEDDVKELSRILFFYNKTSEVLSYEDTFNFPINLMVQILSTYVELLTYRTIKHFKYFWVDSEVFEKEKRQKWNVDIIEPFVVETFFPSLDSDVERKRYIVAQDFLRENMSKLRNENFIRTSLEKFSEDYGKKQTPNGSTFMTLYNNFS